jgi:hypothetical protein
MPCNDIYSCIQPTTEKGKYSIKRKVKYVRHMYTRNFAKNNGELSLSVNHERREWELHKEIEGLFGKGNKFFSFPSLISKTINFKIF